MDSLEDAALEFVSRCQQHRTFKTLVDDYSHLVRQFGFQHYVMAGLPMRGEDPESLVVVNRWPAEWLNRYRQQAYFYDDPVTQASFEESAPFTWGEARERRPKTARAVTIEGEAAELELVDGVGFPTADANHWQAIVSLATDRPCELNARHKGVIYLASILCQAQAMSFIRNRTMPIPHLTEREKEVLTWIADGKTAWEVSMILSVSERTVEKHVQHIREKLDVRNVAQAVAKAMYSRQIHP